MTTAFQSNAFQNNAFQIDAATTVEIDDAGEERRRRHKRTQAEELRSMIEAAFDDDVEFAVAPAVRAVAAPYIIEKTKIDLDRVRADALAELMRLHARYIEDDDEDAIMVLH